MKQQDTSTRRTELLHSSGITPQTENLLVGPAETFHWVQVDDQRCGTGSEHPGTPPQPFCLGQVLDVTLLVDHFIVAGQLLIHYSLFPNEWQQISHTPRGLPQKYSHISHQLNSPPGLTRIIVHYTDVEITLFQDIADMWRRLHIAIRDQTRDT